IGGPQRLTLGNTKLIDVAGPVVGVVADRTNDERPSADVDRKGAIIIRPGVENAVEIRPEGIVLSGHRPMMPHVRCDRMNANHTLNNPICSSLTKPALH